MSGSPFLPPLSKRVSLLKTCFSRPPVETKKKLYFFVFGFFSVFFNFPQENTVSWKFYDFPKTPRRYTNFLKIKILRQNAKNFLRASRDKLWRYTNLWPIYKERRIRWPIYKERRRRRRRRTSRFSSQTTFSVWVSFSPAPEQKGLPTENSSSQTPSGNAKNSL